jgi:hypothetical protein
MIGVSGITEERVDLMERAYQEACAGYGRFLGLVAQVDEEQAGLLLGHGGTASLLRDRLRVTGTTAAGMVREARGLRRCPDTREALAAGEISPQHASQILAGVKAVAHLPQGAERAEEVLLNLAIDHDPGAVRSAVSGLRQTLDPIGLEGEHQAKRERSVCYLSPTLDGMWDLAGTLDPESGAMLATALDALSTGYLHATNDHRSHADDGNCDHDFDSHKESAHDGEQDQDSVRLSGAQRRALALVDLASRALTAGEVGVHGGTRPHVSVLIPAQVLGRSETSGVEEVAKTAYGHSLPPSSALRLVCDAQVTPIRIDGDGQPLNVGRTQRLATTVQRKALAVRDGGCTHPGCRIGPQWCDAHHVVSWLDGGATDLDNLVLLCRRHHTDTHYRQHLATLTMPTQQPSTEPTHPLALAC